MVYVKGPKKIDVKDFILIMAFEVHRCVGKVA